jgi:predicted nucleotidyltransferase
MWKSVTTPYQNINCIFPTKQKPIGKMVSLCVKDKNIKRVIVFGSSTMARCNLWSDIDIYFEFDKEPFRYPCIKDPNEVFDKFNNFSLSQEFKDMIYEEGVIVYEREPSLSILIGKRENCKKE